MAKTITTPPAGIADTPVQDSIGEIVTVLQRLPAADIERVKDTVLKLGEATSNKLECCPACGGKAIVRNGHKHGKQAYLCKGCGKSFVSTTSTVMYMSHQPTSSWLTVLSDTLNGVSLAETAGKLGVKPRTVFFMRHKILLVIESLTESTAVSDEDALAAQKEENTSPEIDPNDPAVQEEDQEKTRKIENTAVLELDETYTLDSYKGERNMSEHVSRPARKHGNGAQKPGLSNEQICICTIVGRNGTTYARSVNRAKPSNDELQEALAEHLPLGSLVLADGATGYSALCERRHCTLKNVKLVPAEDTSVFNLNGANNFHSMIKERLRKYRGVATKYINRYNALFALVYRRRWLTFNELSNQLLTVNVTSHVNTYFDVKSKALLSI